MLVPHVQKGAVLIVTDQRTTRLTGALALGLLCIPSTALADVTPAVQALDTVARASAPSGAAGPLAVVLTTAGRDVTFITAASTVEAFLAEQNIHVSDGDFVSAKLTELISSGMHLTYRPAVPVVIVDGGVKRTIVSSASTVGEVLAEQKTTVGPRDTVFPAPAAYLSPKAVVRIDRTRAWTTRVKQRVAPRIQERFDPSLAAGTSLTVAKGTAGVRVATVAYEQRNDSPLTKRILGYQILRPAHPRIVVHGSRPYAALENIAAQGFAGALHFAGAALHVIATAYTSSCYGCSGYTASGTRAGLGIIAVDPRVIPLGTHLFIPGYGRAVAGDTGGAIVGHRVDLGFETVGAALRFGSREVTVYVVK